MSTERDLIIWKLDRDLSRARLALGRIYNIVDKASHPETEQASNFIDRDDVDKIMEVLQDFFNYDKTKPSQPQTQCGVYQPLDRSITHGLL